MEVRYDGYGWMYLARCWEQFATAHSLEQGHILAFSYFDGDIFTIKIYDGSLCRRYYDGEEEDDADVELPVKAEDDEDE